MLAPLLPEQRALTRVFRQSGDDAFCKYCCELRIAKLSNKSAALHYEVEAHGLKWED